MVNKGLPFALWMCTPWAVRSLERAVKKNPYTILYDGYEYRAIQEDALVDKVMRQQSDAKCHTSWHPLPEGYELVPDTAELRKVLTQHTWSAHSVVLKSLKAYTTFSGNGIVLGQVFGDSQDKAHRRVKNGVVEYTCPWECYQILMRRPIGGSPMKVGRTDSIKTKTDSSAKKKDSDPKKADSTAKDLKKTESTVKDATEKLFKAAERDVPHAKDFKQTDENQKKAAPKPDANAKKADAKQSKKKAEPKARQSTKEKPAVISLLDRIPTEEDAEYVMEPLLDAGLHHLPPTDFELMVSRQWWNLAEMVLSKAEEQGVDFADSVPKAVKAVRSRKNLESATKRAEKKRSTADQKPVKTKTDDVRVSVSTPVQNSDEERPIPDKKAVKAAKEKASRHQDRSKDKHKDDDGVHSQDKKSQVCTGDDDEEACLARGKKTLNKEGSWKSRVEDFNEEEDEVSSPELSGTALDTANMPRIMYQIAYHKACGDCSDHEHQEVTHDRMKSALNAGFQGIEIVGQPESYRQPGVDQAFSDLFASGTARESLFIQAKVNPQSRVMLNPDVPIKKHIALLIRDLLSNLGLKYLDSLVLHSSFDTYEETVEAWRAMERAVRNGKVRTLGIWNLVSQGHLEQIYSDAITKPAFVKEFFYSNAIEVSDMREWCANRGIHIQSLWTQSKITDKRMIDSQSMKTMAAKYSVDPSMLFLRYLMEPHRRIVPIISAEDKHFEQYVSLDSVPLKAIDSEGIDEWLQESEPTEEADKLTEEFAAYVAAIRQCSRNAERYEALSLLSKRQSTCQQPKPLEAPKLVVLLGSHLTKEERLVNMQQLLSSLGKQEEPAVVFASISAATPELLEGAQQAFADFEDRMAAQGTTVHAEFRSIKTSQFMHYASLVEPLRKFAQGLDPSDKSSDERGEEWDEEEYEEYVASVWVLMTDDDDLWHPCRSFIFSEAINRTLKTHGMAPLAININAQNTAFATAGANASSPEDVDHMLFNESALVAQWGDEAQYWHHACPLRIFLDFMLCSSPEVLRHESCDRRLTEFMRCHCSLPVVIIQLGTFAHIFWMYFHRQHDEGRVSVGMWKPAGVKVEDSEIAKTVKDSLRLSYAKHDALSWDARKWAEEKHTPRLPAPQVERKLLEGGEGQATVQKKGVEEDQAVARICAELRRFVERMLAGFGAWHPIHGLIEMTLNYWRLNGTVDTPRWGEFIAHIVQVNGTRWGLPRRPCFLMGQRGDFAVMKIDEKFWVSLWTRIDARMLLERSIQNMLKFMTEKNIDPRSLDTSSLELEWQQR
eukprot:gnl/MRDRNA2_/MRDRNA2_56960_c0_seq1.p1 gnl/MRDRNA2_/MRDRNA2_56960_c0~~gnl/MRDRNA2_/MRDRNA2_56960_c0_seq1.p1  ORF type:complete len:1285 (+),score=247.53 gnl/MRDRNA2_/MRDRNA2_56960_c0_seq1:89-3943(+)